MPYVKDELKELLQNFPATNPGELNYQITVLAIRHLMDKKTIDYNLLNNTYGAMLLAASEFKRRLIDPYEDRKIAENGDVYPAKLLGFINKGVWDNA